MVHEYIRLFSSNSYRRTRNQKGRSHSVRHVTSIENWATRLVQVVVKNGGGDIDIFIQSRRNVLFV